MGVGVNWMPVNLTVTMKWTDSSLAEQIKEETRKFHGPMSTEKKSSHNWKFLNEENYNP